MVCFLQKNEQSELYKYCDRRIGISFIVLILAINRSTYVEIGCLDVDIDSIVLMNFDRIS